MTVPRITGPQVARTAEREQPLDRSPFIAAQGAERLLDTVDRMMVQADEQVADESELELGKLLDHELRDPERGVLQTPGVKALSRAEEFTQGYDALVAQAGAKLTNRRQRELFGRRAEAIRQRTMAAVQGHVGSEMRAARRQDFEALMSHDREELAALTRTADPAVTDQIILDMSHRAAKFGDSQGESTAAITMRQREVISKARLLQLRSLMGANKIPEALALEERVRDQFLDDDARTATDWLGDARVTYQAQVAVDKAIAAGARTRDEVEAALESEPEDVRQQARAMLQAQDKKRREDEKVKAEDAFEVASRILEQAGPFVTFEQAVPVDLRRKLTADMRHALRSRFNAPAQNDAKRWITFSLMDPQELAEMSRAEFAVDWWSYFDGPHRNKAEEDYKKSRAAGSPAGDNFTDARTWNQQLTTAGDLLGYTVGQSTKTKDENMAKFIDAASRELDHLARGGSAVDFAARQALIDRMVREWTFGRGRGTKRRWELDEGARGRAFIRYSALEEEGVLIEQARAMIRNARRNGSRVLIDKGPLEELAAAIVLGDSERIVEILQDPTSRQPRQ